MQDDWPGTIRSTAVAHLQAIVPVGNMADDVFASYASLVTAFRQVSFSGHRREINPYNEFCKFAASEQLHPHARSLLSLGW
jgi:hypothetical protein